MDTKSTTENASTETPKDNKTTIIGILTGISAIITLAVIPAISGDWLSIDWNQVADVLRGIFGTATGAGAIALGVMSKDKAKQPASDSEELK